MEPRVLAFRPKERVPESLQLADEVDVKLKVLPLIITRPARDGRVEIFLEALAFGRVDMAVFSSPSSFRLLMESALSQSEAVTTGLRRTQVVAIGERTALELRQVGVEPMVPAEFSSSGILDMLEKLGVRGRRIFLLRSSEGTPELSEGLSGLGALVEDVALYDLVPDTSDKTRKELKRAVLGGSFHAYAFTSSMTVSAFFSAMGEAGVLGQAQAELRKKVVGAMGRPTRQALRDQGVSSVTPPRATFRDLLVVLRDLVLAKTL